jgi:SGNH hydrolase-like domain, acetyltransferase AlgX
VTKQQKKSLLPLFLLFAPLLIAVALYTPNKKNGIKFKDYLNFKYPLPKFARKINALLQIKLLGHTNVGNIHIGKNNWVFYITESDGSSNQDFWAISTPHIEQKWLNYVKQMAIKPYGLQSKYFFVAVPNKESVYPEKTNYFFLDYIPQSKKNYFRIVKALEADNPDVIVSLYEPLVRNKQNFPTYYSADTHWNSWGIYVAHLEILKKVNTALGLNIQSLPIQGPTLGGLGSQDILGMFDGVDKIISLEINPGPNCVLQLIESGKKKTDKVIWIVGDSFGEGLRSALYAYFHKVIYIRYLDTQRSIPQSLAESGVPDLIIEERVERYLSNSPK